MIQDPNNPWASLFTNPSQGQQAQQPGQPQQTQPPTQPNQGGFMSLLQNTQNLVNAGQQGGAVGGLMNLLTQTGVIPQTGVAQSAPNPNNDIAGAGGQQASMQQQFGPGNATGSSGGGSGGGVAGGVAALAPVATAMCCWILLESYNGKMPVHVRVCRDEFAPTSSIMRRGYKAMANWLVPWMRESKLVREAVWTFLTQPLERWGGWYCKVPGYEDGWIYAPFKTFWFTLWKLYGTITHD